MTIERTAGFGGQPMTLTKWLAHSRAEKTAADAGAPSLAYYDRKIAQGKRRNQALIGLGARQTILGPRELA